MPEAVAGYCRIRQETIYRNDGLLFRSPDLSFQQFADAVYRDLNLNYPRFHKMDNLCKLGFLAADILLNNNGLTLSSNPYDTGVILANHHSSIDTDTRYATMVSGGVASPAVFVYSLPNIVIGEICIRHGLKGENTFFISGKYDIGAQVAYINNLFANHVLDSCLAGWVEYTGNTYEAFMYVVKNDNNPAPPLPHTTATVTKLYQFHND